MGKYFVLGTCIQIVLCILMLWVWEFNTLQYLIINSVLVTYASLWGVD